MSRDLFNRIADGILEHDYDGYFTQKRSASGALGLHPLQKMTAAMRMLTYGIAADGADEYIRSAEATNLESCKKFVIKVCEVFGERYLRSPNEQDIARLLAIAATLSLDFFCQSFLRRIKTVCAQRGSNCESPLNYLNP
jgi:hypothetical protein